MRSVASGRRRWPVVLPPDHPLVAPVPEVVEVGGNLRVLMDEKELRRLAQNDATDSIERAAWDPKSLKSGGLVHELKRTQRVLGRERVQRVASTRVPSGWTTGVGEHVIPETEEEMLLRRVQKRRQRRAQLGLSADEDEEQDGWERQRRQWAKAGIMSAYNEAALTGSKSEPRGGKLAHRIIGQTPTAAMQSVSSKVAEESPPVDFLVCAQLAKFASKMGADVERIVTSRGRNKLFDPCESEDSLFGRGGRLEVLKHSTASQASCGKGVRRARGQQNSGNSGGRRHVRRRRRVKRKGGKGSKAKKSTSGGEDAYDKRYDDDYDQSEESGDNGARDHDGDRKSKKRRSDHLVGMSGRGASPVSPADGRAKKSGDVSASDRASPDVDGQIAAPSERKSESSGRRTTELEWDDANDSIMSMDRLLRLDDGQLVDERPAFKSHHKTSQQLAEEREKKELEKEEAKKARDAAFDGEAAGVTASDVPLPVPEIEVGDPYLSIDAVPVASPTVSEGMTEPSSLASSASKLGQMVGLQGGGQLLGMDGGRYGVTSPEGASSRAQLVRVTAASNPGDVGSTFDADTSEGTKGGRVKMTRKSRRIHGSPKRNYVKSSRAITAPPSRSSHTSPVASRSGRVSTNVSSSLLPTFHNNTAASQLDVSQSDASGGDIDADVMRGAQLKPYSGLTLGVGPFHVPAPGRLPEAFSPYPLSATHSMGVLGDGAAPPLTGAPSSVVNGAQPACKPPFPPVQSSNAAVASSIAVPDGASSASFVGGSSASGGSVGKREAVDKASRLDAVSRAPLAIPVSLNEKLIVNSRVASSSVEDSGASGEVGKTTTSATNLQRRRVGAAQPRAQNVLRASRTAPPIVPTMRLPASSSPGGSPNVSAVLSH